ncbi:contractile injection system tape measure protein, partial [Massilia frigida]|uniref:contractile injection system tape measure protein n=1 Tax=Massilia frigida TaxID=2609281 RepID=UPI0022770C09
RIFSALLAGDAALLPADIFSTHSEVARAAVARIGARSDVWARVAQRFPLDVLDRMTALLAPQRELPVHDRNRWLATFMHLTSGEDTEQRMFSALLAGDAALLPADIFSTHSEVAREAITRIGARPDVWKRVAQRFPLDILGAMTALLAPQSEPPANDREHWLASFMQLAGVPFDAHQRLPKPAIPILRDRIDIAADPEQRILAALLSADADGFEACLLAVQADEARQAIARIGARFDVWQLVAQRFPLALLGRITALLAPRAASILRDLHAGANAATIPERRRWLASIMHLTATPFDAARYTAAMNAMAIDTSTEPVQRILSALLAADAAALPPDALVVHADAARQAIARIGARADIWQPVARRFPLALLDDLTALMAPAAPAILRQPQIAGGAAILPARERWLASMMHLAATPFDPVRYAAAVGAPVPSHAPPDVTVQPLQRILAALGDADAAALAPDLLSAHSDAARQAIARTGARFDVWQRVAWRFPLALLDELTTLVAPQAPAILRNIAAASAAQARDLWLASIMHLAVTPFDAQRYEAALRAPSASIIDLWQQLATRMAAVDNHLQRDMQMQAIAAHAAHSASPPDFLRAAHAALGHAQRIDLGAVDARARTAFLLRALVDGDPTGLTPAVFAGLGDHARKAVMEIGARATVWEPVAQHFPAQVLDALSALLEPHAATAASPDRARWLAAIMQLTAAPAAAAQPATHTTRGDPIAQSWQAIKAHMTSPDSVLQHAISAYAQRSADTASFLRAVNAALERGEAIDLEAIAEHVDSQPAATTVPPSPENPMPAAPTTRAPPDPDVLRRIAAHLDGAGEHGKNLLDAAQAHAGRSAAPQAYLHQVLDDLANERAVDLDDLDARFAAPPAPAPKRAAVSCAHALATHPPAQRAALAPLLHGAGDDSTQFSAGLLESVVTVLAGADLEAVLRCAREVGGALARDLPAPAAARIGLRTRQFAFGWFFEQRLRFEPAAYARALASHLAEPADTAAPTQRHAPALAPATASALDDECDALFLSNAGQVLAGPYLPRLFAMVGLTEGARFKSTEAAERAVHLVQFIVSGQTDCPEYLLGLNKVLCGLTLSAPIMREIVPTDEERDAVDTMLRAMIAHWKTIGNTSPDGLRQSFLQRRGSMHLKDDAWRLKVEAGSFDMLLDALPWSFSVIRHPWMERAVHVEWR